MKLSNFFKADIPKIKNNETSLKIKMEKSIHAHDFLSSLFPFTFFNSVKKSLSGESWGHKINFYDYCIEMKDKFIEFYLKKRYFSDYIPGKTKIENFINGDENIFIASKSLPYYFMSGLLALFVYNFILGFLSWKRFTKQLEPDQTENPNIFVEQGNAVFFLLESQDHKRRVFDFYRKQNDTICLTKINPEHFKTDLNPIEIVRYWCKVTGVKQERVLNNLEIIGT